jgi:predicted aspartyl protease
MCKSGNKFANRLESEDIDPTMGHIYISNSITATEPLELIEVSFTCKTGKAIHVRALPDTGANITAISPEDFKQTGNSFMEGTAASPKSADGAKMKTIGKAMFCVEFKDKVFETIVYIVKGLEKPILSLAMLKKMKLVPENFPHAQVAAAALDEQVEPAPVFTGRGPELDGLMNKYAQLFDGKCTVMKDGLYHIELDPEAVPINTGASRMILDPYMPALKKEIETLKAQGIIEEVTGATPWLHPIVVVPKKNTTDIRM